MLARNQAIKLSARRGFRRQTQKPLHNFLAPAALGCTTKAISSCCSCLGLVKLVFRLSELSKAGHEMHSAFDCHVVPQRLEAATEIQCKRWMQEVSGDIKRNKLQRQGSKRRPGDSKDI